VEKKLHIYFPGQRETSISIDDSDPMFYRIAEFKSSEIRDIFNIHTYKKLKELADNNGRSISGYLKYRFKKYFEKLEKENLTEPGNSQL